MYQCADDFAASLEALTKLDFVSLSQQQGYEIARTRALRAVSVLHHQLESPLELSRRLGWQEPSHVASIKIALNFGFFNELQKHGLDGSVSISDLAKATGANEDLTARIMRHLASWGTVREAGLNRFGASVMSNAMLDPKVSSGIEFWIHLSSRGMSALPKFLLENCYHDLGDSKKGVWQTATGQEKGLFTWLQDQDEALTGFSNHLAAFTDGRAKWTTLYPAKERILHGAESTGPLMVDVGGGVGQDLVLFQEEFPQPPGRLFVQDQSSTLSEAKNPPRIELQVHDFFTPQPIVGSRVYFMHYVLHDWGDEDALKILSHLKQAMKKDYSKILVDEFVLASEHADPFNTSLDITLMSLIGSKERTEADWRSLFKSAGLEVVGIWSQPGNHESVIEVVLPE